MKVSLIDSEVRTVADKSFLALKIFDEIFIFAPLDSREKECDKYSYKFEKQVCEILSSERPYDACIDLITEKTAIQHGLKYINTSLIKYQFHDDPKKFPKNIRDYRAPLKGSDWEISARIEIVDDLLVFKSEIETKIYSGCEKCGVNKIMNYIDSYLEVSYEIGQLNYESITDALDSYEERDDVSLNLELNHSTLFCGIDAFKIDTSDLE